MIAQLIAEALQRRWLVLGVTVLLACFGAWAYTQLPIDAYPDISGQTVQVIAGYPGRAPEQVEREVTIPIEIAMRTVPKVETIRSRTIFGLTVVQMLFEEGVEGYWARQRVSENLNNVVLPEGAQAQLAPMTNNFGEVLRYEVVSDNGTQSLMDLRMLNDWVIIPRLLRVPGVGDVNNFGGLSRQFTITFRPADLERYGLRLNDVVEALKSNNASAGGGVINRGGMSFVIRGSGSIENVQQIENIFVKSMGGTPVYLRNVATVSIDFKPPLGIFSRDRTDESVAGILLMRRGENPSLVLGKAKAAVAELNDSILPRGVRILTLLDRSHLVDSTLDTVSHSVLLGITLVMLVLLLLLGKPSTALLVAATIPFSLLFALGMMYLTSIPIGLLSIGAIDFGIIVDGAIIMAEHVAHRVGIASRAAELRGEKPDVSRVVLRAALEMERPVFFSVLMIVVAYLPLLSLRSIEGLLFRPMALTMVYALGGALLFALFVVPIVSTILFRKGLHEGENWIMLAIRPFYSLTLRAALAVPWLVVAGVTSLLLAVAILVVPNLGFEFLPYMDEGVIWVRANFPEGTSLQQNSIYCKRLREIVLTEFPDIRLVTVQTGRNDSGTDPYPPSRNEMGVFPFPQKQWTQYRTKPELLGALSKRLREEFPTVRFNFTQPIIDGVTEDTNGTSANLAVEFSGPDSDVLLPLAQKTVDLLRKVRGAVDVNIEQESPQPQLQIVPDRALCARYNVRIEDVTKLINTALGGEPVGTVYEKDRRFEIAVRLDRRSMSSPEAVKRLPVFTAENVPVPLASVADITVVDGQTMIARENSRRRLTVRCDIVGRDQGGFVQEAQELFNQELAKEVPAGYKVAWLGMFENLQRAKGHFLLVLPITIALLFVLMFVTFGSFRAALLLLLSMPFALVGGVVALYLRGMNLNVSTGVGFAALFGVSIMNGVLMIRAITVLRQFGMPLDRAIERGAVDCLRPILLASLVAILGLLPASLATGLGSDVQRPLATVIVWGLFSSTALTLFVVPVLYGLFAPGVPPRPEGDLPH